MSDRAGIGAYGPGGSQWTGAGAEAAPAAEGEAQPAWKELIRTEFATRQIKRNADLLKRVKFPLITETYNAEDVLHMMEPLLNGQLTMHDNVRQFEKDFAKYTGAKYVLEKEGNVKDICWKMMCSCTESRSFVLRGGVT